MAFSYSYPRPAVTCDCVVFTMHGDDLAVLLVQRKNEPCKGQWALPGGFVNENEPLARAAARELAEETGLTSGIRLEEIGAFGDPGRDPRGHTVTIAWAAFLVAEAKVTAADDAAAADFVPVKNLVLDAPPTSKKKGIRVAFDHAKIIRAAYKRLCRHLDDPVRDRSFDLLPSRFTIAELQHLYEGILGKTESQRAFKKRLLDRGLVVAATTKPTKKPADQLYRWDRR